MLASRQLPRLAALVALGAWWLAWAWFGRHHMLDDALIHLRYAENLRATGHFTYDGETATHGASSLLYVALLAGAGALHGSPLLPKALSLAVHAGLLAWLWRRAWRDGARPTAGWGLLLLVLAGPLALRWLTDGMETGLTLAAAAAIVVVHERLRAGPTRARLLAAAALSAAVSLLRVELVLILALAAVASALQASKAPSVRAALLEGARPVLAVAIPAAAVLAALALSWGHLLPDGAVAKASGAAFNRAGARGLAEAFFSAGTFGVGLASAWLGTAIAAGRASRSDRPAAGRAARPDRRAATALFVANLACPLICLATVARGQMLQGIRHLAWPMMFSCLWNLGFLDERPTGAGAAPPGRPALLVGIALLALWIPEALTTSRIVSGRSETYLALARADWSAFADRPSVARDIGMFGYFSRTRVCDLSGLVNGRAMAAASIPERIRECAGRRPAVAFLTDVQATMLAPSLDVAAWTSCREVAFTNVSSLDLHRLYVDPRAGLACP
jgi:hypothetical protein